VIEDLQQIEGVKTAHNLLIWSLTIDKHVISVHLTVSSVHKDATEGRTVALLYPFATSQVFSTFSKMSPTTCPWVSNLIVSPRFALPLLLKCLFQASRVNSHLYVCSRLDFIAVLTR
jgi:hypothetical protein